MTTGNDIRTLLQQYLQNTISPSQKEELFARIDEEVYDEEELLAFLDQLALNAQPDINYNRSRWQPDIQAILHAKPVVQRNILHHIPAWLRVAAVVTVITVAVWLTIRNPEANRVQMAKHSDKAAPVSNHATITLADGSVIHLDSAANGQLNNTGNVLIMKPANERISYVNAAAANEPLQYNTLVNPRGSKVIQLTLADGSQVWLNAGTTLRYPVAFNSAERKVELNGEAYFEIAANAAKPFSVEKGRLSVQVLGTSFNINAYDNEEMIKATLLTGRIKLINTNGGGQQQSVTLLPGQQARVSNLISVHQNADTEQALAWKNGYFQVENAGIQEVMRLLERWYNITVKYEGPAINRSFSGKIPRTIPLSGALRILKLTEIEARFNGNDLVISSK